MKCDIDPKEKSTADDASSLGIHHVDQDRSFSISETFGFALSGIVYAFKTQRNIKIHIVIAIIALLLGFLLDIDQSNWIAIILCICGVLGAELFNTSIETITDLVSPDWNELAKHAKDVSAAAVLIMAIGSVVVGCIIFIPRLLMLINGA